MFFRSIRVGILDYPSYSRVTRIDETCYPACGQPFPFPRLNSFEYTSAVASCSLVQSLEHCRELRNLTLVWSDLCSFDDLGTLSQVWTLRLYLVLSPPSRCEILLVSPVGGISPCSSITTLALVNCSGHSKIIGQCLALSFPRLRVLRLEKLTAPVPLAYDFIQRHSTLLEVNVHFACFISGSLRLEALLKLIHGTGTWIAPPRSSVVPDQPSALQLNNSNPIPPSFPHYFGWLFEFAFCRTPRSTEAVEWCSPIGSVDKRYDCTAVALSFEADEMSNFAGANILFRTLREHLPALEELRVTTRAPSAAWRTFTLFMVRYFTQYSTSF